MKMIKNDVFHRFSLFFMIFSIISVNSFLRRVGILDGGVKVVKIVDFITFLSNFRDRLGKIVDFDHF